MFRNRNSVILFFTVVMLISLSCGIFTDREATTYGEGLPIGYIDKTPTHIPPTDTPDPFGDVFEEIDEEDIPILEEYIPPKEGIWNIIHYEGILDCSLGKDPSDAAEIIYDSYQVSGIHVFDPNGNIHNEFSPEQEGELRVVAATDQPYSFIANQEDQSMKMYTHPPTSFPGGFNFTGSVSIPGTAFEIDFYIHYNPEDPDQILGTLISEEETCQVHRPFFGEYVGP